MKVIKTISVIIGFMFLFACASGSTILTGTARPAIDPNEVKIYLDPPANYETIGLVEASGDVEFSRQATQDRVIAELKKQAAKIGANGVLLVTAGSTSSSGGFIGGVSSFNGPFSIGVGTGGSSQTLAAQARAIYVSEVVVEQEQVEE